MKVLVDTSVWSLVLRRRKPKSNPIAVELENLIADLSVQIIGPIRQEILSGIREESQFKKLRESLQEFPDLPLTTFHYEQAAEFFNLCRAKGIQGSNTDFLICSVEVKQDIPIFTTDQDFSLYQTQLPIKLHAF